jgi:hypothetical protein
VLRGEVGGEVGGKLRGEEVVGKVRGRLGGKVGGDVGTEIQVPKYWLWEAMMKKAATPSKQRSWASTLTLYLRKTRSTWSI